MRNKFNKTTQIWFFRVFHSVNNRRKISKTACSYIGQDSLTLVLFSSYKSILLYQNHRLHLGSFLFVACQAADRLNKFFFGPVRSGLFLWPSREKRQNKIRMVFLDALLIFDFKFAIPASSCHCTVREQPEFLFKYRNLFFGFSALLGDVARHCTQSFLGSIKRPLIYLTSSLFYIAQACRFLASLAV